MPKQNLWFRILQNAGLVIISLGLLYGGVQIIRLELPFWSMFYGLIAIGMGVAMTLVAFSEVAKSKGATVDEYHEIPCSNCGKMTLVPYLTQKTVCSDCQMKFIKKVQTGMIVFLVLMLPAIYHLTQLTQNFTRQARTPVASPMCEEGEWKPEACRCGEWETELNCPELEQGRKCLGIDFCCNDLDGTWNCRVLENPSDSSIDGGEY